MPNNSHWTKEQDKILRDNSPHIHIEEIVPLVGRSKRAISKYAKINNINVQKSKRGSPRKGDVSVLLKDTLETYYWIGFILADGCFHKNQLTVMLSSNDGAHLSKLAAYLKTKMRYCYNDTKVVVAVQNMVLIPQIMKKYGIPQQKTFSCVEFPSRLTKPNMFALICGFLDGDGSRIHNRKNLYGFKLENHKTWEPFYRLMEEYVGPMTISFRPDKPTIRTYFKNAQAKKLVQFAIKNNLPVMERKFYAYE